jgi:LDH2 family malate/lactate/ureidoglycolate dehydrogenase
MGQEYVTVTEERLRAACVPLFEAMGTPRDEAELVVDVHVDSDLRGEESHGVRMLDIHLARIKAGGNLAASRVTVLKDRKAVALLDAHHSLGQVVAARAMEMAIAKAGQYGIGMVGVRNANSYTSAKYYPLMAVNAGMIGKTYTNSVPMMPPHGGARARVGNNPLAIAAPAGDEYPLILDMACTIAVEKVRQAGAEDKPIPPEWALGLDGNPTTDAKEALEAYTFLPFGGYKAFGLGVAHEMLTSVLCGGGLFTRPGDGFRPFDDVYNCCQYFEAINIEWFLPVAEFRQRMDAMIRQIKDTPLRSGFDALYLPGERGMREMAVRRRDGIPIHASTLADLRRWAGEVGAEPIRVEA